jgi:O-antigen/teichoic acid export membrane protein
LLHGGLFAIFAFTCGKIVVSWVYLFRNKRELLKAAWLEIREPYRQNTSGGISWWGEIWPMQWRIAISWLAGYFVFQLFTPVLFHFHGAVVAGQMGMTLNVSNALLTTSMTLIAAKAPEFGKLIAECNWAVLDTRFSKVLTQSLFFVTVGALAAWGLVWFLQDNFQIGERFIPSRYAALLFATVCLQIVISSFAVYLRAHKQEPFMFLSVLVALLQAPATLILGKHYAVFGITLGFFCVNLLFTVPSSWLIWMRCRRKWHAN